MGKDACPIDTTRTREDYESKMLFVQCGQKDSYFFSLRFNPLVTAFSLLFIATFVVWAIADENTYMDVDCKGTWSECSAACELGTDRTWTEISAQMGNGLACSAATDCDAGDGQCAFSKCEIKECTVNCEGKAARLPVSDVNNNAYPVCPEIADCAPGEGECSADSLRFLSSFEFEVELWWEAADQSDAVTAAIKTAINTNISSSPTGFENGKLTVEYNENTDATCTDCKIVETSVSVTGLTQFQMDELDNIFTTGSATLQNALKGTGGVGSIKPTFSNTEESEGKWESTEATDCPTGCGEAAGGGTPGVVSCNMGGSAVAPCDPNAKPEPDACPATLKCESAGAKDHKGAGTRLAKWQSWVTTTFTWLYIGSQNVWLLFLIIIWWKYGHIKLGEEKEFSDLTWFTMLFAAGIGVGFIKFGASEPIWHYLGPNRYSNESEEQRAQDAINMTIFHWGVHGWIVYAVVGLSLSIASYVWGLPMTIRSCFYPLIGDRIFGIAGDFLDCLSVCTTMFGVCTSLGFGAEVINAGLHRLNEDVNESADMQTAIVWVITGCATISVVTGLGNGIKVLSEITFYMGNFILLCVFFLDDTWYLLNVLTQSTGYYLQWLMQLGWWCDAFQMQYKEDELSSNLNSATAGDVNTPEIMDGWTVFYWGWWISWAPFVGMFIAKISKGRTISEFILGVMTCPLIYSIVWFCVFGGAAIRMERRAADVMLSKGLTADDLKAQTDLVRLTNEGSVNIWYETVGQAEYGLGPDFLTVVSLAVITLYFVTSSDSGSLVIDCLCANGVNSPPAPQRILWALAEGACATALIQAGKDQADGAGGTLGALSAASVCAGLPYTIIICFMCTSLWRACGVIEGTCKGNNWKNDILKPIVTNPFTNMGDIILLLLGFTVPAFVYFSAAKNYNLNRMRHLTLSLFAFICNGLFWIFQFVTWGLQASDDKDEYSHGRGAWALGWVCFCGVAFLFANLRNQIRTKNFIIGNIMEDIFAALVALPLCVVQCQTNSGDIEDYPTKVVQL